MEHFRGTVKTKDTEVTRLGSDILHTIAASDQGHVEVKLTVHASGKHLAHVCLRNGTVCINLYEGPIDGGKSDEQGDSDL
jgi:hypothetical protein